MSEQAKETSGNDSSRIARDAVHIARLLLTEREVPKSTDASRWIVAGIGIMFLLLQGRIILLLCEILGRL